MTLRRYCYRVASVVGIICIHIFGFSDPAAREYAIDLGLGMQLTNILRDIKRRRGDGAGLPAAGGVAAIRVS